jgi:hypothetical protein
VRYKLTAAVEGDLAIEGASLTKEHCGILYELSADSSGKVTTVSVSQKVPDEKRESFRSAMEPAAPGEGVAARVVVGGDRELRRELSWALQKLESSFGHTSDGITAIRSIRWDEPEDVFVPETADDKTLIAIFTLSTVRRVSQGASRSRLMRSNEQWLPQAFMNRCSTRRPCFAKASPGSATATI